MAWLARYKAWRKTRRRDARRMRALEEADVVVVSFGKSGRTWLRAMLSHLYHQRHGIPETELLDGDNFRRRVPAVPSFLFTHDGPREPWNRDRARALRLFALRKVVFLARDPRDVAVSIYHHTLKRSSPEVRAREGMANEGGGPPPSLYEYAAVRGGGGKIGRIIGYLNAWAELLPTLPRAHLVTYEAMRADPAGELARLAAFADRPFEPAEIERAVEFASFDSLRRKESQDFFGSFRLRPADASDPQSFKVRRGKVGGYREDFTPQQAAELDARVAAELSPAYGYGDGRRDAERVA